MPPEYAKRITLADGFSIDIVGDGTRGRFQLRVVTQDGAEAGRSGHETVVLTAGFRVVQYLDASGEQVVFSLSPDGSIRGPHDVGAAAWPFILYSEAGEELERPAFQGVTVGSSQDPSRISIRATVQSDRVVGDFDFELLASPSKAEVVANVVVSLKILVPAVAMGVAPLSTMFLFGEGTRFGFEDYRTAVHDSDGLWMRGEDGRVAWRSLNNPPAVANSYFTHTDPHAFGLVQRSRDFHSYEDEKSQFERRPSVVVEPHDGWGNGFVRLIETPTRWEDGHNVVVTWMPKTPVRTEATAEFRYRLRWSDFVGADDDLGKVQRVAVGAGGVSGVEGSAALRKFVVDFAGPALDPQKLPSGPLDAFVTVSPGQIEHVSVFSLGSPETIRLVIDATIDTEDPVELRAYLIAGGRQLTETWVYQWRAREPALLVP